MIFIKDSVAAFTLRSQETQPFGLCRLNGGIVY